MSGTPTTAGTWFFRLKTGISTSANLGMLKIGEPVAPAPVITLQPKPVTVMESEDAVFSIAATGAKWYMWEGSSDGATWSQLAETAYVQGTTTATLTIKGTTISQDGRLYRCVAGNGGSRTPSASVKLTVTPITKPIITKNPTSATVKQGGTTTFSIEAKSTSSVSYRWQRLVGSDWVDLSDNPNFSGTNTPTLTVKNASASINGYFVQCVATNTYGSTPSTTAKLTVTP
jgi:hypothetical protein